MILLTVPDFSLPLTNPVIIFSLVLFIILFAPILLNRLRIPNIIGLILAGVVIGPFGANLLLRDSSIVLFGTVGLLYIMFLAGLEMKMEEVRKNGRKIFFFGIFTFAIPMVLGVLVSYYILGYGWLSCMLVAAMISTHTLIAYPILSRYGVNRNRSVLLTVGGTLITDILSLVILAVVSGNAKGDISAGFWIRMFIATSIFVAIIVLGFPVVTRWFFKKNSESVAQYIYILAMVFLASFLAEVAGLEPIIGAFLAGLVLNKFIPTASA
ncbi:MAG: cation:proton antiporter, partial [Sphingobacteriales bacterium]